MLVHAVNDRARRFYEYYGSKAFPAHAMTLMLRLHQSRSDRELEISAEGSVSSTDSYGH